MNPESGGKWGIMGGIFDPIHFGHLILAETAMQECGFDGILFVVSLNPPHREAKPIVSFDQRLMMTKLATADNDKFAVSDLEKELASPGYTLAVIEYLEQKFPKTDWHLILGADNIAIFDSWHKPDELVGRVKIVVGQRPGYDDAFEKSVWIDKMTVFKMPLIEISSTAVRQAILDNKSIRYFVPDEVGKFIMSRGLYK